MRLDIPRLVWPWILAEGKAAVKQVIFFREIDLQYYYFVDILAPIFQGTVRPPIPPSWDLKNVWVITSSYKKMEPRC